MKFNIGDIVEFNYLDELTRNHKRRSGLLIDFEDNSIHENYSVSIVLYDGKTVRVPTCKLLKTQIRTEELCLSDH